MKQPTRGALYELITRYAKKHGEDSEPDHEVGDLQDALALVLDTVHKPRHLRRIYDLLEQSGMYGWDAEFEVKVVDDDGCNTLGPFKTVIEADAAVEAYSKTHPHATFEVEMIE